jgi:hypothetical protein
MFVLVSLQSRGMEYTVVGDFRVAVSNVKVVEVLSEEAVIGLLFKERPVGVSASVVKRLGGGVEFWSVVEGVFVVGLVEVHEVVVDRRGSLGEVCAPAF